MLLKGEHRALGTTSRVTGPDTLQGGTGLPACQVGSLDRVIHERL